MAKRIPSTGSHRSELVTKSREAALTAIRVFNDPLVSFKSETFIVLMIIAWTYLLHAHYLGIGIEYRYYKQRAKRRVFDRTNRGAYKYWELEHCLNQSGSPIDLDTANNLKFLIGLRHKIEHQMTQSLDAYLSGRYQACALNFNEYLKKLFSKKFGIDQQLTYSIQFNELTEKQMSGRSLGATIPKRLRGFVSEFDEALTPEEFNSPKYSTRLIFTRKIVNRVGQADKAIDFIDSNSKLAKTIEKEYWVKKEIERPKFRPTDVVKEIQAAGFPKFRVVPEHSTMWKEQDAKNSGKGYGVEVQGKWYWYQSWIDLCIKLCKEEGERYC